MTTADDSTRRVLVAHYGEVALKRGNRKTFERRLGDRLREGLMSAEIEAGVTMVGARFVVSPKEATDEAVAQRALTVLTRIPGVANAALAYAVPTDLERIQEAAATLLEREPEGRSFKVETRRGWKGFPLTSIEVSQAVAPVCLERLARPVDVHHPDVTLFVEILERHSYVTAGRVPGPGGLPVGSASRLLSFLSGGIDSPVASWLMARRGAKVTAVHYHNHTHEGEAVLEKLADVCTQLAWTAGRMPLLIVPFEKCQLAIVESVPAEYRMILYRRAMFRIGAALARKEKALGYITGDSLGQVASQTAENLLAIHEAANMPVYAPLMGSDKQEVIERARQIGTFDISIRPHADCCSFLVAKHPMTTCRLEDVLLMEQPLDWDALVGEAVEGTRRVVYFPDPASLGS